MPTNDIKAFAAAGGANVLTQSEYQALAALSTGFTSGKASAKEVNKAIRQSTLVAAALAQFISDQADVDVLDDGNVSGLAAKILAAVNKTSQPLDATLTALAALSGAANKLPYFSGTDIAALTDLSQVGRDIIGKGDIAAVLQYLGLPTLITGNVPVALNTLEKIANAIGNDANFSNSLSVILGNKQNKDTTLTALSGKTVAQLLQYLGLPELITGNAPVALNTLEKIANAIGNDANFSNSLSVILGNKQAKDDTLTNLSGKTAAQIAVYIGALRQSQNLADLPNVATARVNLEVPRGVDAQMPFAWCKFNGVSGQVYRAFNISSVKKDGTGQYAFNFTSPSVTPDYIVVGTAVLPGAGADQIARVFGATDRLSTGFNAISMDNNTDTYADSIIDVIVIGG